MVKRAWLSITPEPERELPSAVATLLHGSPPPPAAVRHEAARIERLILHGSQRRWLDYLHSVLALTGGDVAANDAALATARARARAVIENHHNLLLGLPGPGARRTAADRARLAAFSSNHDDPAKGHP